MVVGAGGGRERGGRWWIGGKGRGRRWAGGKGGGRVREVHLIKPPLPAVCLLNPAPYCWYILVYAHILDKVSHLDAIYYAKERYFCHLQSHETENF